MGSRASVGIASAIAAHSLWGFFPLYWRLLSSVPPASLAAHRIVWSFVLAATLCLLVKPLRTRLCRRRDRKTLMVHAAAAVMIATNWTAFLAAVNSSQVLQSALGYYINPLVNVLLGVVFLRERLRWWQTVAVGLAAIGVIVMAGAGQGMPWLSLTMAFSFGFYALLKKQSKLQPIVGLTMEVGILFPLAAAYLVWVAPPVEFTSPVQSWSLLIFGGLLTLTPLAFFALAARRVSLSVLGIVQYLGPTLQWICGVLILSEPVTQTQLLGFGFVWSGVIAFAASSFQQQRGNEEPATSRK